jgi:hypothetical protein
MIQIGQIKTGFFRARVMETQMMLIEQIKTDFFRARRCFLLHTHSGVIPSAARNLALPLIFRYARNETVKICVHPCPNPRKSALP